MKKLLTYVMMVGLLVGFSGVAKAWTNPTMDQLESMFGIENGEDIPCPDPTPLPIPVPNDDDPTFEPIPNLPPDLSQPWDCEE